MSMVAGKLLSTSFFRLIKGCRSNPVPKFSSRPVGCCLLYVTLPGQGFIQAPKNLRLTDLKTQSANLI